MNRGISCAAMTILTVVGVCLSKGEASPGKARILYLGDSLSIGAFGATLDSSLRSSGFEVRTVVAGGASPYYWLKNYQALPCTIGFWEKTETSERRVGYVRAVPKIEDLIADLRPNVVVVQTGINLYATLRSKRRSKEENVEEVRSLIDQMCYSIAEGGAVSYWVLPPDSHEERYSRELQDELSLLMRSVVERYEGTVFESQKVTKFVDPYPATDGIHYGPEEARGWAVQVSRHFNDFMRVVPPTVATVIIRALPLQDRAGRGQSNPISGGNDEATVEAGLEVELRLRLEEKSVIRNPAELDYANALGVYEYRVLKDVRGNYPYDRIRIAQGIVFGRKLTGAAKHVIGYETELCLVPLSKYKNLSTWQVVDDLRPNFEMPLYTPKLD